METDLGPRSSETREDRTEITIVIEVGFLMTEEEQRKLVIDLSPYIQFLISGYSSNPGMTKIKTNQAPDPDHNEGHL